MATASLALLAPREAAVEAVNLSGFLLVWQGGWAPT
ncbi:hypothetical protein HDC93_007407 [Streptomyces sp. AK010]|nr:hypothetical protein [Streptomyces sp. AK010]